MAFNILKFAVVTALGWALVRTFGAAQEQVKERSKANSSGGPETGENNARAQASAEHTARESAGEKVIEVEPAAAAPEATAAQDSVATAPQDLVKVKGIGPAIENLLKARGIATWAQLAATEVSELQSILDEAGPRYRVHDPSTWPAQAEELAKAN